MGINRNIDPASYDTGTALAGDIADTLNYVGGLVLGEATNVSDTNTITADIPEDEGYSSPTDGAIITFVPVANNTGAVTFNAVALHTNKGAALQADDLVSGKLVAMQYRGDVPEWRLLMDVLSQAEITTVPDIPPYSLISEFLADGTFTAPYDCYVRIWLFGGGASGTGGTTNGGGGGAGGTCVKDKFFMTSGQQLAISLGAAGSGSSGNGHDGGDSTITGPNSLSMTAGGGKGGGSSAGGVGGTSSGGDINLTGQPGAAKSGSGGAGGVISLLQSLSAQSAGSASAYDAFDAFSTIGTIGPFSSGKIKSGNSTNDGSSASSPSRGCGSGSRTNFSSGVNSNSGGKGFAVIEYTTSLS